MKAGPLLRLTWILLAEAALLGCDRSVISPRARSAENSPVKQTPQTSSSVSPAPLGRPVKASWYRVPNDSLARRRAGQDEFTAAHNHLALGTLVRVTSVANNRTVLVRITDRGIKHRGVKIDLCREAAEKLGMVREGITQVRLEVLSEAEALATLPKPGSGAH